MESTLKIGDKVRVGERIGEAIRLDQREASTIIKVAFEEGPAKDFVCPPTKVEKILTPIEQIENNKFDSPIHFDLHYEAIRLSMKKSKSLRGKVKPVGGDVGTKINLEKMIGLDEWEI